MEPIHEEWEKFVASMDGKKHGLTDAFKFAWKAATDREREACHALRQTLPNPHENCQVSAHAYDMALVAYGKAIRARGET